MLQCKRMRRVAPKGWLVPFVTSSLSALQKSKFLLTAIGESSWVWPGSDPGFWYKRGMCASYAPFVPRSWVGPGILNTGQSLDRPGVIPLLHWWKIPRYYQVEPPCEKATQKITLWPGLIPGQRTCVIFSPPFASRLDLAITRVLALVWKGYFWWFFLILHNVHLCHRFWLRILPLST